MDIQIDPRPLAGAVTPPPSKSQAHRLVIAAALGPGDSLLRNMALSQDIEATLRCAEALGARWERPEPDVLRIHGCGGRHSGQDLPRFDCGESGSTLRFFIPIALAAAGGGVFTGRGRLMERPQGPYFSLFDEKGVHYAQTDGQLTVRGTLTPGGYRLPGNVSSQFFTGLLFALPLLEGPSAVTSTTALESVGYVSMTMQVMERSGVCVARSGGGPRFQIPSAAYRSFDAAVEADWSQAAFWYAAQGIGNGVTVTGMNEESLQGDRVIARFGELLRGEPLGGGISAPIWGRAPAAPPPPRPDLPRGRAVSLDISHCPDLAPPLAAWGAALPQTELRLKNAGRLRIKESDRLSTITAALTALGAEVIEGADDLRILGRAALPGGAAVDCAGDHRIAMMAAIAATRCERPVTLLGADCVKKSYPDFWEVYQRLGGEIHVL